MPTVVWLRPVIQLASLIAKRIFIRIACRIIIAEVSTFHWVFDVRPGGNLATAVDLAFIELITLLANLCPISGCFDAESKIAPLLSLSMSGILVPIQLTLPMSWPILVGIAFVFVAAKLCTSKSVVDAAHIPNSAATVHVPKDLVVVVLARALSTICWLLAEEAICL
jgi:hypothetical protein